MSEQAEDGELLERVSRGDEPAYQELYRRLAPEATAAARRVIPDAGLADDVVQEVFVSLWNDPARYVPERGSLRALLATAIKNRAIDQLRAHQAYDRAKGRASDRIDHVLEPISRVDKTGLENALEELPEEQRELLLRVYREGKTQAELADDTGLALGTVKSRLRLAMGKLRQAFGKRLPRFRGQGE